MTACATVKTYRAASLAEALASAKSDLGPEAVVLSAREIPSGFLGIGRRTLELCAVPPPAQPERESAPEPRRTPLESELPGLREELLALRRELQSVRGVRSDPSATAMLERLGQDLTSTAGELRTLLSETRLERSAGVQAVGVIVMRQLIENGIEPGNAEALVRSSKHDSCDVSSVRRAVAELLLENLMIAEPIHLAPGRRIAALVGPTGAGKTTTIAKIAAKSLQCGRRVGLISTDTYRIGATDQLRCYAELMGLSLETADTPTEMQRVLKKLEERSDIILIDSAGLSQRDRRDRTRLAGLLRRDWVTEIHLVLPAATGMAGLQSAVQLFRPLNLDRILWTKLDEAAIFGALLNGQFAARLPVSYLTTGQRVPEDIEAATPERISRLLLMRRDSI